MLCGFHEFIEAKTVEVLEVAELILAGAVGLKEICIGVEDIFATGVDAEVMDTALGAEDFAEFFVFFFAFLPSSGDECDIAVDAVFFEDMVDGGFEALGSKHDQVWHVVLASLCGVTRQRGQGTLGSWVTRARLFGALGGVRATNTGVE